MTIPILCMVILLQLIWIFILKLQIERLETEIAMKYNHSSTATKESKTAQKGMRSFKIGK